MAREEHGLDPAASAEVERATASRRATRSASTRAGGVTPATCSCRVEVLALVAVRREEELAERDEVDERLDVTAGAAAEAERLEPIGGQRLERSGDALLRDGQAEQEQLDDGLERRAGRKQAPVARDLGQIPRERLARAQELRRDPAV